MKPEYFNKLGMEYCLVDSCQKILEKSENFDKKINEKNVNKVLKKNKVITEENLYYIPSHKNILIVDKGFQELRHNLLNDLNCIYGMIQIIKETSNEESIKKFADIAHKESMQMIENIKNIN